MRLCLQGAVTSEWSDQSGRRAREAEGCKVARVRLSERNCPLASTADLGMDGFLASD